MVLIIKTVKDIFWNFARTNFFEFGQNFLSKKYAIPVTKTIMFSQQRVYISFHRVFWNKKFPFEFCHYLFCFFYFSTAFIPTGKKSQKKQNGGVYFCVYSVSYWMPIQQKIIPPKLSLIGLITSKIIKNFVTSQKSQKVIVIRIRPALFNIK